MKTAEEIFRNNHTSQELFESKLEESISLKDAIIGAEEYADQFKPKWIPVSERLPDVSGTCCCLTTEQNDMPITSYYSFDAKEFVSFGITITHWIPLPDKPTTCD